MGDRILIVDVANVGNKPAMLTVIGIEMQDGSVRGLEPHIVARQFWDVPLTLAPGEQPRTFWYSIEQLLDEQARDGSVPRRLIYQLADSKAKTRPLPLAVTTAEPDEKTPRRAPLHRGGRRD